MSNVVGLGLDHPVRRDIAAIAAQIGADVAGPASDEVDEKARFPAEAVEALRRERMLSTLVPVEWGGDGASIVEVADAVTALGQFCASTAMIYAMHQIQVACLVRHGDTPYLRRLLRDIAERELLLASATTEAGVGGDVRSSVCAVEPHGNRFRLEKNAPVISYGEHADAILATARRTVDSAPNDQVLVVVHRLAETLEPTSGWDTLGFRGTCSPGFRLRTQGDLEQILPDPFADISSRTMLPVSHIAWASVWLGIATSAVNRAGAYVRAEARKKPGTTPPAALRLAEVSGLLQQMRALVHDAARRYDATMDDPDALSSLGFALHMNNLKVSASTLVVDVVSRAMVICGMAGYREDSPFSLGRHLRDAYGAALMINNDRINGNNATMLLVHKDL
jgi:acyl-CoA dehydrogenase